MRKQVKFVYFQKYKTVLLNIFTVLAVYFLCRILFLIFNSEFIFDGNNDSFSYWILLFWGATKFDISAITIINIPYILFSILPFKFRNNTVYKKIITVLFFYIFNILAFALNFIDIIYSRFTQKRMTFDILKFAQTEGGFTNLIPNFLKDYWYIVLFFLVISTLFIIINKKINKAKEKITANNFSFFYKNILQFCFFILLCFIGVRCSFGEKTISIISASKYAKANHIVLVLNTPFTLIKTVDKESLEEKYYFSQEDLKKYYEPIYHKNSNNKVEKHNVIVIILESFSLEYSAILNTKLEYSQIPNFDSIAKLGQILPCISNSGRSMEGIPAIISGLPTLMNCEYINSIYSSNKITSIPEILKKYGYRTAFFHGGKNGTLNMDNYAIKAGFENYYGKNEYNNDKDFDKTWGIFDHKFLNYFSKQLDTIRQPFFTTIFTLSSHHPYTLPEDYKKQNSISENNVIESVKYSDWALGDFFKQAQNKEWFNNTVFIITADHSANQRDGYFTTVLGRYLIPVIVYSPTVKIPKIEKPFVQQIDILPTVMDLLNINDSVFAFGNTFFDNNESFSINYNNNNYNFYTKDYVIIFNGEEILYLFDINDDKYLRHNIYNKLKKENKLPEKEINLMKAMIQTYNKSLIENKLFY